MSELKPGVYRHYKDGRFYLLLWTAELVERVDAADVDLFVYLPSVEDTPNVSPDAQHVIDALLCTARSHGPMRRDTRVCVYVPLYADKPGRRISVRPAAEWIEAVDVHEMVPVAEGPDGRVLEQDVGRPVPRFEYVGQTVPQ